jgi:LysM repeat protein
MSDPVNREPKPDGGAVAGQLRFFQISSGILLFLLLAGVGYYEYREHQILPVAILVDGKPVATVESLAQASQIVKAVHERQVGPEYMDSDDPHFRQDVEFKHTTADVPIDSLDAATAKLSASATTVVQADAIIVDKKWTVALPDAATAQAAVDELRQHYADLPPNVPVAEKPTFVQNVSIERRTVPASLTRRSADAAAQLLWTPPQPVTYVVEPHQTGWLISKKFHMTFADFLRANAGSDVNRLAPGDTVIVSKTFPPVDVIVKKMTQQNQTFGGTGVRQVTMESTYIDGNLVGTPITESMMTISRATPRSVVD